MIDTIRRWASALGDDLIWICVADGDVQRVFPAQREDSGQPPAPGQIPGWKAFLAMGDLFAELLDAACPAASGTAVVCTSEAVLVSLGSRGESWITLGLAPSVPLDRVAGFLQSYLAPVWTEEVTA